MTITDARGTLHRRCDDRTKLRLVSLVPSLTELLCDLGLGHAIVGRTGYCVHPADDVEGIPTIGGTRTVDIERVRALAPTHLVMGVDENETDTIAALAQFVPHVIATHPKTPRDNLALYRLFGQVFDCEREADRLAARFDAAWRALEQSRSIAARSPQRVLVLTEKDPWRTVARDAYPVAMLALIDWRQITIPADAFDVDAPASPREPAITLAHAVRGVDRLLLSSDSDRFTDIDLAALRGVAPHVQRVDGELLSWYGSRAILGLNYLTRLVADTE